MTISECRWLGLFAWAVALAAASAPASGQQAQKPNIVLIVSDDFGYGDAGAYGGGENRGMPTPNLDRLAAEGMQFLSFYAQPSCTPGRAAMQTGRIPNRSGMTTVAFQGQGGGLPAAEWTLASVLKTGGYKTFFTGKWHRRRGRCGRPRRGRDPADQPERRGARAVGPSGRTDRCRRPQRTGDLAVVAERF